jgi:dipeptidyl aminopeptidase/acylaminoacyl peptidase
MVFLEWRRDSRALYYVEGKEGSYNVKAVSLAGAVTAITSGPQTLLLSSVSRDGVAVGTVSTAHQPPEIVRLNLRDGSERRVLTAINEPLLRDVQLGRVEEIRYDSTDDTKVQGWIVYPPDFEPSRKYPLMLAIHGGPEGMYEAAFDFAFQEMAAAGYVVLYTNPRGSTGYGADFVRPIYDAYPGRVDFQDLMSGVDAVVKRGFIDTQRLYVQGCSGGGTLTAWVVTQTDRFAGAAAQCTIVNNISMAGSTDMVGWWFNHFKKPFWEDPTSWLATSSIMHVGKVKTPTLVMVGENDLRTPVAQSTEFFSALKLVHVPTKLLLFRGEGHGTTHLPSNMMRTQLYMREWFGKWRRVVENGKPVWRERPAAE